MLSLDGKTHSPVIFMSWSGIAGVLSSGCGEEGAASEAGRPFSLKDVIRTAAFHAKRRFLAQSGYFVASRDQTGCEAEDSDAETAAATSGKSWALRIFSSSGRTV